MFHISHFALWWCIFHLWAGLSKGSTDATAWLQISGGWILLLLITMDAKMHSLTTAVNHRGQKTPHAPTKSGETHKGWWRSVWSLWRYFWLNFSALSMASCMSGWLATALFTTCPGETRAEDLQGHNLCGPHDPHRHHFYLRFNLILKQPQSKNCWLPMLQIENSTPSRASSKQ